MYEAGRIEPRSETAAALEAVARTVALVSERTVVDVEFKEGRDVVTDTDVRVEDVIRHYLSDQTALPVVGEERGGDLPPDSGAYWLVDPICGTRNFASGLPLYSVNVALVEGGQVVAGVVGSPSTGETLVGELGRGCWRWRPEQAERIHVDGRSRVVVVEEGASVGRRRRQAADLASGVIRADRWDFRSFGTTQTLPFLAAGRIAGYGALSAPGLHSAAGCLLVTEAGGWLTDIDGRTWSISSHTLLAAATEELHDALLELARAALGDDEPDV